MALFGKGRGAAFGGQRHDPTFAHPVAQALRQIARQCARRMHARTKLDPPALQRHEVNIVLEMALQNARALGASKRDQIFQRPHIRRGHGHRLADGCHVHLGRRAHFRRGAGAHRHGTRLGTRCISSVYGRSCRRGRRACALLQHTAYQTFGGRQIRRIGEAHQRHFGGGQRTCRVAHFDKALEQHLPGAA